MLALLYSVLLHLATPIEKLTYRRNENNIMGRQTEEQRLLDYLLHNYERAVRPVKNSSTPVVVRLGMTLTNLFDMDERNQVLTINVWLDQEWTDELLTWDPEDFNGITSIRIPCDLIWLPDIVLYNNADDYTAGYMRSRAMLDYKGTVFWPPPTQLRSTCKVDVKLFPFDFQRCSLKFGSWTYHGFQVDITNRSTNIDLSNYQPSGEFDLVKVYQKRRVVRYTCCPEPYPDLTFVIHIRRKTLYYLYNIVFPILMLSVLMLLVFILPPDSGEKIALGITVLLSFSIFVLAIAAKMPETSDSMPLIAVYLTLIMILTSVSVLTTVIVLNFHHRGSIPMSPFCRHFFLVFLRNLLSVKGHEIIRPQKRAENGSMRSMMRRASVRMAIGDMAKAVEEHEETEDCIHLTVDGNTAVRKTQMLHEKLINTLEILTARQSKEEESEMMANEWKLLAQVIDRILFWLFLISTFTVSIVLLLIIPFFYSNSEEDEIEL